MEATNNSSLKLSEITLIGVSVLISCIGLVWLDKDTKGLEDMLQLRMIIGFLLYGLPAFFVCIVLLENYRKKYSQLKSYIFSVVQGIPLTFLAIIILFYLLKFAGIIDKF